MSLYTDYDIKFNKDGSVSRRSRACKNGDLLFRQNGAVDKRCKAYKQNKIILDSDGYVDGRRMGLIEDSDDSYESISDDDDYLYTDDDIKLNKDGSINLKSRAVLNNEIFFKSDGSIDKRCSAWRQGRIILNSADQINFRKMGLTPPRDYSDYSSRRSYYYEDDYQPRYSSRFSNMSVRDPFKSTAEYRPTYNAFGSRFSNNSYTHQIQNQQQNDMNFYTYNNNYNNNFNNYIGPQYGQQYNQQVYQMQNQRFNAAGNDAFLHNQYQQQCQFEAISREIEMQQQFQLQLQLQQQLQLEQQLQQQQLEQQLQQQQLEQQLQQQQLEQQQQQQQEEPKIKVNRAIRIKKNDQDIRHPKIENQEISILKIENREISLPKNENQEISNSRKHDQKVSSAKNEKTPKMSLNKNIIAKQNKTLPGNNVPSKAIMPRIYKFKDIGHKKTQNTNSNDEEIRKKKEMKMKKEKRKKMLEEELVDVSSDIQQNESKSVMIFIFLLLIFLIFYFLILSIIPLPNEKNYLSKCPKHAFCRSKAEGNRTKYIINYCDSNYMKIENGIFQVCSPSDPERLSEYIETLKAAVYISKSNGKCFFNHHKLNYEFIKKIFPKSDIYLLQTDDDFNTIVRNNVFLSTSPQYTSFCRSYRNSIKIMPHQTVLLVIGSFLALLSAKKYALI